MKNMYQRIKSLGRKVAPYALAAGVVGAGVFGGQKAYADSKLPLRDEVVEQIKKKHEIKADSLFENYQVNLDSARTLLNSYISDAKLDTIEQKAIYEQYSKARTNLSSLKKLDERIGLKSKISSIPEGDKKIYSLLEENLKGWDMGTPNLENELRDKGLDVSVSNYSSKKDDYLTTLTLFGSVMFMALVGGGISCLTSRKK